MPRMSLKEATVVLVDCSESMRQPFQGLQGHKITRFDAAREIAWRYLARKALLSQKRVEVGVVAFGTDETENPLAESMEEYSNIVEVAQLESVSIDNIRRVKELQPSTVAGELLAGLTVAVQMLNKRIGKRIVESRLIVLTDAASPIEHLLDELQGMSQMKLGLTVVGFDFADGEEEGDLNVQLEAATQEEVYKSENERMLRSIVTNLGEKGGLIDAAEMYLDMQALRKEPPTSKPTPVPFELSPLVTIRAQYIALTMAAKRPSLKQLEPEEDSTKKKKKKPTTERVKKRDSKGRGDEVKPRRSHQKKKKMEKKEKEKKKEKKKKAHRQKFKAYRYGGEFVPVGEEDIEVMKLREDEPSLKLLCIQPEALVPRAHCLSNCLAVVGQADDCASKVAIAALAHALHAQKRVAMVRFVRRKKSAPELGVLTPHVDSSRGEEEAGQYLVYNRLPFLEDDRDLPFFFSFTQPPRKAFRPSDDQRAAALDLVDAMMIQPKQPGGRALQFVPSPGLAATNQLLMDRALDPTCPLTLPPDDLLAPLRPDPALLQKAEPAISHFHKLFTFKAVEKKKGRQKRTWADLISESHVPSTQVTLEVAGGGKKKARSDEEEGPTAISSTRPQEDLAAMLRAGRVDVGLASMQVFIHSTLAAASEQDMYGHYALALSCMQALRSAALQHGRGGAFNQFCLDVKRRHGHRLRQGEARGAEAAFWDQLQMGHTPLITTEEDGAVELSAEQAAGFWARREEGQEGDDAMEVAPSVVDADLDLDADF